MDFQEFREYERVAMKSNLFDRWLDEVEKKLGHDLDGDEGEDGYSLDGAAAAFRGGKSAAEYVSDVQQMKKFLAFDSTKHVDVVSHPGYSICLHCRRTIFGVEAGDAAEPMDIFKHVERHHSGKLMEDEQRVPPSWIQRVDE